MTLQPASLPWLVATELKLNWRRFLDMFGRLPVWAVLGLCVGGVIALHLVAWAVVVWSAKARVLSDTSGPGFSAGLLLCVLTWMAAQGLLGMSRALQDRANLDLFLASPLPVRLTLAAKLVALAASALASVTLLAGPLANVGIVLDGPAWLAVYPTLLGLALIATTIGTTVAIALFLWLEPGRARFVAQIGAAFIGGAFLLGVQVAAMLPPATRRAIADAFAESGLVALVEPIMAGAQGEVLPLAGFVLFAVILFAAGAALLSESFRRACLRAAGAPAESGERRRRAQRSSQFGSGLTRTLHRKEWRLLWRDHGVFAQLALQIIYTVPLAVVLLRSIESMSVVLALAPTIVVIAAQVSASLAWITVSGEDAPELIAAAPVRRAEVELAKITAIGLPVLLILALPLAWLAFYQPLVALQVALFAAAACISTALLNLWHPMPGKRRGMLRRHSQSKVMALLEHFIAMLWAIAIVLALMGTKWALLPIACVALVLAACRPPADARAA